MPPAVRRVGYWMSDKKIRKLDFTSYCQQLRRENAIEMVLMDLDRPLAEQGPFSLIVHKLTDLMAASNAGDERASAAVRHVEEFLCVHPSLPVLDPLHAVRTLTDRSVCYRLMQECSCVLNGITVCPPNFTTIRSADVDAMTALRQAGISFPIVCKPLLAHGSDLAHKMAIIFSEEGLCDLQVPCVAQQFVSHNAVLFKVYVIGDSYYIVERPSIKNFTAGEHRTIFFDSHDVSKATSDSYLNQVDEFCTPQLEPVHGVIAALVRKIREKLSLTFFGVDVIIEKESLRHYFIDINYFPGYDGVDMFPALTRLIESYLDSTDEIAQTTCTVAHLNGPLHAVVDPAEIITSSQDLVALATKTASLPSDEVQACCKFCQNVLSTSLHGDQCPLKLAAHIHQSSLSVSGLSDVYLVAQEQCV